MWALRRASYPLKNRGFNIRASRISCAKSEVESCYSNEEYCNSDSCLVISDGYKALKRFYSTSHGSSKFLTGWCSFSSQAHSKGSDQEEDDLEDGFSELESPARDEESGDELISEPELSDGEDDGDVVKEPQNELELSDTETDVTEKRSPRKRASSALFNAILVAPGFSVQTALDKWEDENDLTRSEIWLAMLNLRKRRMYGKALLNNDPEDRWKWFENCLGALDGTFIPVLPPAATKARYKVKKGGLRDKCSATDSRVLANALVRPYGLKIPHGRFYLVDAGYTNGPGLLAPYRSQRYHINIWRQGHLPQSREEVFNMNHSAARNVVEDVSGLANLMESQQSEQSNPNGGKAGKEKQQRRLWTSKEEEALLVAMLDCFGDKWKGTMASNRGNVWNGRHHGVGEYERTHKGVSGMMEAFPMFEDWQTLFGHDRATGEWPRMPLKFPMKLMFNPCLMIHGMIVIVQGNINLSTPRGNVNVNPSSTRRGNVNPSNPRGDGNPSISIPNIPVPERPKKKAKLYALNEMMKGFISQNNAHMEKLTNALGYDKELSNKRKSVFSELMKRDMDEMDRFKVNNIIVGGEERLDAFFGIPDHMKQRWVEGVLDGLPASVPGGLKELLIEWLTVNLALQVLVFAR
ncbi:hypothetical protein Acr_00g0048200 [Actinidia rufa]|uniref:Uncharacterized protein n=1 Tax=Actinidia rufa TaxID=165716 RepID=A0A7J0DK40_9ERIC|nr:hypothetical protein Acr_00g0048200 [Actinidia rufa]